MNHIQHGEAINFATPLLRKLSVEGSSGGQGKEKITFSTLFDT